MNLFESKKTVASIVAGFQSMIDDLDSVHAENTDRVRENEVTIAALQADSEQALTEAGHALTVREKLAAIIALKE